MKPQIIGTGLSGLVGSRIVELLSDRFEFIDFSFDSGVDITDFDLLKKKFSENKDVKAVIHLAAFTDVDTAWKQNEDKNGPCYKVNVLGSRNIAQLARETNKYLVYISTDFVFDGKNPPMNGYNEEDRPNPIEWYGKTKYWAEKEIEKSGCQYVILRIAFPFKAKPSPKNLEPRVKLDLVRKIIEKFKNEETFNLFSDQIITPTFIDDITEVVKKCLEEKPEGIYHCVGSTSLSPYDLAYKIADIFGFDKSIIKKASLTDYLKENPNSRLRQINLTLSNKKLEKELGIKMLTFDEALELIRSR